MTRLYVVATPIGNLADLSPRAADILSRVAVIAAEDTRRARRLLDHAGLRTPLTALHDHNERRAIPGLLRRLEQGDDVALISDAGTPLVSDPGFPLVRAAQDVGIDVQPVPGPSALTAAISVAGIATDRFVFEGFLPARSAARRNRIKELADETRTIVWYEAPHRVAATLGDLAEALGGEREAAVCRELSKVHEQSVRASLDSLVAALADGTIPARGEFVIVVSGAAGERDGNLREGQRVMALLLETVAPGKAAQLAHEITGVSRKVLYGWAMSERGEA
ncbi:MAG: 16S rRNA (cytidine(1402)-2'-O)-methyltransferase [Gammaproteobacteria bacterium]|nr:16S rRNA (cytidine(1402)-2'-O)-methyltransferase [Gammaproteobacteria bacterium]